MSLLAKLDPASLWAGDPLDWGPWLVFADQLTERGDPRGEFLLLESSMGPDADLYELLHECLEPDPLGLSDTERLQWAFDLIRRLKPLMGEAPKALVTAIRRPLSQVIAMAESGPDEDDELPATPRIEEHHLSLVQGLWRWVDEAFDGVPPPDSNHLTMRQAEAQDNYERCGRENCPMGRWQDLTFDYLLSCQWSLAHLDAQGTRHYLPAVCCFDLRHRMEPHPDDTWLTESLEYTLMPSGPDLQDHQRRKFSLLTASHRTALAAFTCSYWSDEVSEPWMRAVANPDDWYTAFVGTGVDAG